MSGIYTLPCVRWITNSKLLYSTGTAVQGSEMTYRGGMRGWEAGTKGRGYVYKGLIHMAVQQKLTKHCKAFTP